MGSPVVSRAAGEHGVHCGVRFRHRFLHGECAGASGVGDRSHDSLAIRSAKERAAARRAGRGWIPAGRIRLGSRVGVRWKRSRQRMDPLGAYWGGSDRSGGAGSVRLEEGLAARRRMAQVPQGLRSGSHRAYRAARHRTWLQETLSQPERSHREPGQPSALHGRRRRRAEIAVLPRLGPDQRRRDHSVELFHGFGNLRTVPQEDLRRMERIVPPFRLVQQPVLSQGHRIHAGYARLATGQ